MSKRRFEGDFFSGIKLGLPRMSDDWTKEIQRSTSPSTSNADIIARVQGSETVYPDRLPPDDVRRHYRVRVVGPTTCYGKSNWSRWVSAKPKLEVNPSPGPGPSSRIIRDPSGGNETLKDVVQFLGATGNLDEANIRFGATGRLAQFIRQQSEAGPQNLLGQDAGPEQSFNTQYRWLDKEPLGNLGLEANDVVSGRAQVRSATGSDRVDFHIRFWDSTGGLIKNPNSNRVQSSTYEDAVLEDVSVPSSAATIGAAAHNIDQTEEAFARRAMLNRGPIAQSFVEPGMRKGVREDLPVLNLTTDGSLDSAIRIKGGDKFFPTRHTERAQTRDGSSINFNKQYDKTPKINFVPQSALTFTSTDTTTKQRVDMKALNPDVNGFTQRAKLISGKNLTAIDDGFSSTQNTGAPEDSSGADMTSNGDVVFSNLEDANNQQATYEAWFTTVAVLSTGDQWTVHLAHNDGSTSQTWTEVDSRTFTGGGSTTFNLTFTGTLGSSWDLRGRVTWDNFTSLDAAQSFKVTAHGEAGTTGSTQPGVEYNRDDGNSEQSMTPDSNDSVAFTAQEAQV